MFGSNGNWPTQNGAFLTRALIQAVNGEEITDCCIDGLTIDTPLALTKETVGDYTAEWWAAGHTDATPLGVASHASQAMPAASAEPLPYGTNDFVGSLRVNQSDISAATATVPSARRRASSSASP